MNKLKILELFGGIGACTSAFKRLGMPIEIVDYVEIDKYVVQSYNLINDTHFEPQDITKWDKDVQVDFILHGSPCQDISLAGKQAGADENSGTRSSLMYETLRIVSKLNPKYVVWENVKNLVSKKHFHNFQNYIDRMEELGYTSYWKVLNTKDFGVPQNRERVFTISIRKDIDTGFTFPTPIPLEKKLKDVLEDEVDESYFLSDKKLQQISNWKSQQQPLEKVLGNESICPTLTARGAGEFHGEMITYSDNFNETTNVQETIKSKDDGAQFIEIKNNTKKGYLEAYDGDGVNINSRMEHQRGNVQQQISHTIDCQGGNTHGVVIKDNRNLKEQLCDELLIQGKVKEFDVFDHNYTNQRFNDFNVKNSNSDIAPTLTTRPDTLGVVVTNKNTDVYSDVERRLFTEDGNIKRYIGSETVDEFKEGQMATTSFPNGYGHGPRTHNLSISLNCIDKPSVKQNLRIRKLTPRECWRLQGRTDEEFDKVNGKISNAQLYKQAGNSITVDVLCHIFKELFNV